GRYACARRRHPAPCGSAWHRPPQILGELQRCSEGRDRRRVRGSKASARDHWSRRIGRRDLGRHLRRQQPVDAGPADAELGCDLAWPDTLPVQYRHLIRLYSRGWLAPLVPTVPLRFRDPFLLAFKHHLALELPDGADYVEHEPAGLIRGIQPHGQNAKTGALAFDGTDDPHQVAN